MNVTFARAQAAAALAVAVGCGSGPPSGEPATAAEQSAALGIVAHAQALAALPTATAELSRALASSIDVGPAIATFAPDDWAAWPRAEITATETLPECVTQAARARSFSDCQLGGHLVDGTASRLGSAITAELEDVVIGPARTGAATVFARITAANGTLWGTLEIDATWVGSIDTEPSSADPTPDPTIDATVRLDGVTTDAGGCPIAGQLTIAGFYGPPETEVAKTLAFGPACGDVAVIE